MNKTKEKTRSFANTRSEVRRESGSSKFGYSPERSEGRSERYNQDMYKVRFKRKDL